MWSGREWVKPAVHGCSRGIREEVTATSGSPMRAGTTRSSTRLRCRSRCRLRCQRGRPSCSSRSRGPQADYHGLVESARRTGSVRDVAAAPSYPWSGHVDGDACAQHDDVPAFFSIRVWCEMPTEQELLVWSSADVPRTTRPSVMKRDGQRLLIDRGTF